MTSNVKRISTLTALSLIGSPAFAEKQNVRQSADVNAAQTAQSFAVTPSDLPDYVSDQSSEITVEGSDVVAIRSPALSYAATFHAQEAVKFLSRISPIKLGNISLDENGRVLVRDANFATKVLELPPDTNMCESGCCCGGCFC